MRKLKRLAAVLFSFCLLVLASLPVMAAEKEYTYTVRFFSGAQGTINGGEVVVYKDLHYGDRVTFNQRMVSLSDNSKYYIRGIREGGKDNNTVSNTASFEVTGDTDYVVAYGILGEAVAYTINYVDEDGNALAASETYYGNVGDRPVVAFLYLEGYQPQAYNLTGTLLADASQNIFTFTYTRIDENAPVPPPVVETTPVGGGVGDGAAAGMEVLLPDAPVPLAPGDGLGGGVMPGGTEGAEGADAPDDLVDIRDEEVPLANNNLTDFNGGEIAVGVKDFAKRVFDLPLGVKVGIISSILLAGGGGAWFVLHRSKKRIKENE